MDINISLAQRVKDLSQKKEEFQKFIYSPHFSDLPEDKRDDILRKQRETEILLRRLLPYVPEEKRPKENKSPASEIGSLKHKLNILLALATDFCEGLEEVTERLDEIQERLEPSKTELN